MTFKSKRHSARPRQQQQVGGILGQARNTFIYGSHFTSVGDVNGEHTQIIHKRVLTRYLKDIYQPLPTVHKDGFERLQKEVAASAFHNSKQRVDPPRCHKHTREAILDELFSWIVGDAERTTWIAWVNGAAGAGKSAICQSLAEMCILRGILVASFFFFRTDSTRNTIDPLVATLAYQLIQLLPDTKDAITQAIESNPLIFEQSLESQLEVLIVEPLRCLPNSNSSKLLLIVDGVDECSGADNQRNLIRVISTLLRTKSLPLIVLFGSRRETQLQMAFNTRDTDAILLRLPLDDNYQPSEDIRRFLNDSFAEIKFTHPFNDRLSQDWPTPGHVQQIVDKSSGQFIYASVVVMFVSSASSNPAAQLEIVRGLRSIGRSTPFAQLDALYRHIFSQVQELQAALNLLAYAIYRNSDSHSLSFAVKFLQMTEDEASSMLAPLTSVLVCNLPKDEITFLHASLPDFLLDQARSQEYCICTFPTHLSILWFKDAAAGHFQHLKHRQCYSLLFMINISNLMTEEQVFGISDFLARAEPTSELHANIMGYFPSQNESAFEDKSFTDDFIVALKNLVCWF